MTVKLKQLSLNLIINLLFLIT